MSNMGVEVMEFSVPDQTTRYQVLSQEKIATIFPNGYGLVRFRTEIEVLEPDFAGPVHYFGLSKFSPKGKNLGSIKDLCAVPFTRVPEDAFLNYRLLSGPSDQSRMRPTELASQGGEEERIRVVLFEISPPCSPHDKLLYAWEWGFPKLYETAPGKSDDSSFRCIVRFRKLAIELRFAHRDLLAKQEFSSPPSLKVVRHGESELPPLHSEPKDELEYIAYRWELGGADPGDLFYCSWKNL